MYPLIEAAAETLRDQHSLITRPQVLALPGTDAGLEHLLRVGAWEIVDRGLYGPTGVPMSWRRQLMAAILVAPPGSLVSHRAAAALYGVGGLDEPTPEISVPRGTRVRRRWLIAHQSKDLHLADRAVVDHIAVTGPRRLAMDLGATVSTARFRHTVRELRYEHDITEIELLRCYLIHKRQGRNGGGALRDWLDRYLDVVGISESGAELVVLDALIDSGLPVPRRQYWVEVDGQRYRLDIAYPDRLVAVEVNGRQHADDPDVVQADVLRLKRLHRAGWTVLHVRTSHLATDMSALIRELETLLR